MIYKDVYCKKCDKLYVDFACKSMQHKPKCPKCKGKLEIVFNKMSFKEAFKGSHKHEYRSK